MSLRGVSCSNIDVFLAAGFEEGFGDVSAELRTRLWPMASMRNPMRTEAFQVPLRKTTLCVLTWSCFEFNRDDRQRVRGPHEEVRLLIAIGSKA